MLNVFINREGSTRERPRGRWRTAQVRWRSNLPLALRARGGLLRQRTCAVLHRPRGRSLVDPSLFIKTFNITFYYHTNNI